ncbi:hem peroxidase [Dillenia turbinata]|uniref:peroxidase n=1 Tax=Dillenia turbinata TaxID=194707 RepID=A0AAN8ZBL2_9MAGN
METRIKLQIHYIRLLFIFSTAPLLSTSDLSVNFFAVTCPAAEFMVRNTVRSASSDDPTLPGKLFRLLFHDCMVEMLLNLLGGPAVQIPTGRRDGTVSATSNVRPNMVGTSFTMEQMMEHFSPKGLSVDDFVTLSDTSLDKDYATVLTKKWPAGASSSITVSNDLATSSLFDNQYYRNLLAHKGLFQSDSLPVTDGRTRGLVENLANDRVCFFDRWKQSFLKLASVGVKIDEGEIRRVCSQTSE